MEQRPRDRAVSADGPRRPTSLDELRFTPQKPVQWFSPSVLRTAGLRAAINSAFGAYLDKRELQNVIDAAPLLHHAHRDEMWIDYISDTGDGFAPTYSVAWLAAQDTVEVAGVELPRADVVVLGGDEVYPVAGVEEYENRFIGPFEASLPWLADGNPEMYFVAGNHDWYDGLTAFLRAFCQGGWVGARRTRQTRSYFALQLPHRWWLWGIDIQFPSYLDEPQLRYFEHVVTLMREGDQVILCTPEPSWTHVVADEQAFATLGYIEEHLIGPAKAKLMLTLSGDSHHYAHYHSNPRGLHKLTAGGGGAFLRGTNDLPENVELRLNKNPDSDRQAFDLGPCYPDRQTSRVLALGAVTLPLKNPTFVLVPAIMYLLLGWSVPVATENFRWFDGLIGLGRSPVSALLIVAVFGVAYGFARPPDKWVRTPGRKMGAKSVMGVSHTILHGLLFTTAMWLAVGVCHTLTLHGGSFTALLLALVAILGAGFGSVAVGAYLAVCCAAFRAHGDEAFSAMGRTGYKNLLRLHIDTDGVLTVYPLGIRKATKTKNWRLDPHNPPGASWMAPASADDTPKAHFIEPPFTIDGRTP